MQDDAFEWDDQKARFNLEKHNIDFEDAKHVFDDPRVLDDPDDTLDYGEERYRAIGMVNDRLIAVFYTLRDARNRIISARKATPKEQRDYVRQSQPI